MCFRNGGLRLMLCSSHLHQSMKMDASGELLICSVSQSQVFLFSSFHYYVCVIIFIGGWVVGGGRTDIHFQGTIQVSLRGQTNLLALMLKLVLLLPQNVKFLQ